MAELVHSIAVSPLQSTTLEGKTFKAVESDIGRALSGSDSDMVWAGGAPADWAAGVHDHVSSNGGTITPGAGADGVWIKHTGYKYDGGETGNIDYDTANTDLLTITVSGPITIAQLYAGQAIFLPKCVVVITLDDPSGDPIAVEYAIFT